MMTDVNQPSETRKRMAAVLDTRKLALRCMDLEKQLQAEKKRIEEHQNQADRLQNEMAALQNYAELGREIIERHKKESLSRLRAIVQFTGDRNRLHAVEQLLSNPTASPEEITSVHKKITEEFRSLYPTRPFSHSQEPDASMRFHAEEWTHFRMKVS